MGTDRQVEVEGRELKLTNLDKVLYPKAGFTKGEVVDYYAKVGPAMVPHLNGRAVTLRRFPEGVDDLDSAFFEKRCPKHRPKWVKTANVRAGPNAGQIDFCVCDSLPTLIWMAQLAALELHPSLSLSRAPTRPTVLAFDLDPGPPADIDRLLPRRDPPARPVRPLRPRVVPEDLGLEGDAGLRPAQRQDQLRRDQTVRQSDRPAARKADAGQGRLENEKGRTRGQGLRRLVAEPPQQNDDRRLLDAGPRAARPSRPRSPGTRSSDAARAAMPRDLVFETARRARADRAATATSSPRCSSSSRDLPEL